MLRIISIQFRFSSVFTVGIIGRPNVGKSSLFNKLHAGRDQSIVSPEKGVTRDRKEGYSELFQVPVKLIDTAGIEDLIIKKSVTQYNFINQTQTSSLYQKMLFQTTFSMSESDVTLMVVDGREGVTTMDQYIAKWLRKQLQNTTETKKKNNNSKDNQSVYKRILTEKVESNQSNINSEVQANIKHVILVANKCENENVLDHRLEEQLHKLGLGEPVRVSAIDGTGFQDLLALIQGRIPQSYYSQLTEKKVKRRQNFEAFKIKTRNDIQEYVSSNGLEFDVKDWEKEFTQANPYPSDNSDFDDDTGLDYDKTFNRGKIIQQKSGVSSENLYRNKPIQLSIMGRINIGKSTLVNRLLQEERVITDPQPGTTRDSIEVPLIYKGQKVNLVDTAGIETDKNNLTYLKNLISKKTEYALRYSNVVILLIDSLGSYRKVDIALAQKIVREGRGIVMAVNKWDLVDQQYKSKIIKYLERQLDKCLTEVQRCPIQVISAEQNSNIDLLIDNVVQAYDKWNTRISTGLLNDWLGKFKKMQNLPITEGERLRIRFITQIKIRPPTFSVFVNDASLFKTNYLKFIRQQLCKEFNLFGIPIRINLRDQAYSKEKKQLEKENKGKTVKQMFLKQRRISKLARSKLEQLDRMRTKITSKK